MVISFTSGKKINWNDIIDKPNISSDGYIVPDHIQDVDKGGTGITSVSSGDILYADDDNCFDKLSIGQDGYVLKVVSGLPCWKPSLISGMILVGKKDLLTPNATRYLLTDMSESDTESLVCYLSPTDSVINDLMIKAGSAPGFGESVVFTVRVNMVDTAITATLEGNSVIANDICNSHNISRWDNVTIKYVSSYGCAAADVIVILGVK